ncbi:MAG: alkaline phosphatase family protein [Planctomycetes bacterium]|nr:alkaline phosphatase family protein [Planctomycetota bacterium]
MPNATAVINVVGLTSALLEHAPRMRAFAEGRALRRLVPVLPAVTCSVQSSMLTGAPVRDHGIVGNGWYDREQCEVRFWRQSNRLVRAEKVWETARARDASVTCANMFWWYNMYSTADVSVTPRPIYKADGRKLPDVYTDPPELRDELQERLGTFPLFEFWGPAAGIASSRWIARASKHVHERTSPTLMLIYLPHLDYDLQRLGPGAGGIARAVGEIDEVVGELLDFFDSRGVRVIMLSEYGIEAVNGAVPVNRILREHGAVRVREEQGHELLDAGASDAFAAVDHQVAHVYVRDPSRRDEFRDLLAGVDGVAEVLDDEGKRAAGLDHDRAGDLVLVADRGTWFSYRYWLDDTRAPDFARTVDIHRKPGYDPVELFVDPAIAWPKLRIARRVAQKKLGFRMLMDVIPLDESLVRGSHGRVDQPDEERPVLITETADGPGELPCTAVRDVIMDHLFEGG